MKYKVYWIEKHSDIIEWDGIDQEELKTKIDRKTKETCHFIEILDAQEDKNGIN